MDITEFLSWAGLTTGTTGFFFWLLKRHIDKRDVGRKEKEKAQLSLEVMLIKGIGAAISLAEATALAVRDNKCNGEMTKALEYASEVKHEQRDFLTEQGVKNIY